MRRRLTPGTFVATFNAAPFEGGVHFDALSTLPEALLDEAGPVTNAVLLQGDTQPDSCYNDPERSNALNVDSIVSMADALRERGIRPIFVSSEFVFDGIQGRYTETDQANPQLLYGRQKRAVERHLEASHADFAILRLAKVYGEELGDGTLATGFIDTIRRERVIRCATDQYFSPVHVNDVVTAILAVAARSLCGIYHVAGPERLSRMDCLESMLAALASYERTETVLEACSIRDFDLPEPRPLDVSLCVDKLISETGNELHTIAGSCARIAAAAAVTI
jgi:dTDP-4-dehydrorhamnose reductase